MSASNPYKKGDQVKTANRTKTNGIIKYIACFSATSAGGRVCDKKTCNHFIRDYVWVEWSDKKVCSYIHTELSFDKVIVPAPVNDISLSETEKTKFKEAAKVLEEESNKDKPKFNWLEYNGIVQTRFTRDGRPYLVDMAGGSSVPDAKPIEEKELDYTAYNTTGFPTRKS